MCAEARKRLLTGVTVVGSIQEQRLNGQSYAPTVADRQPVRVASRNAASLLMTLDQAEQFKNEITQGRISTENSYILSKDEAFWGC